MSTHDLCNIVSGKFQNEIAAFLQKLYHRLNNPAEPSCSRDLSEIAALKGKFFSGELTQSEWFLLETEMKSDLAAALPKEEASVWLLLSVGLYLNAAPAGDASGKSADAFLFLPDRIPDEVYRSAEGAGAVRLILSSYSETSAKTFYINICRKVISHAGITDIFDSVMNRFREEKEYSRAAHLCGLFAEVCASPEKEKYAVYKAFFEAQKLFAERKFEQADEGIQKCKICGGDTLLKPLLPWWYYHAAVYRAWMLKNQGGEDKQTSYQYCLNMLSLAEQAGDAAFSGSEKDRLHRFVTLEREYLEIERGVDAEETVDPALTDREKHLKVQRYYQNAFGYFWSVWSTHVKDWEAFRETDIADHIWCMIKALAYNPNGIPTGDGKMIPANEVIDCIDFLYNKSITKDAPKKGTAAFQRKHIQEYGPVIRYIASLSPDEKKKVGPKLLIALLRALEILHTARIRDFDQYTVYYYTSFSNLKYLLSDEKEDCKYRLPIFHAEHMNDPEEGIILRNYFASRKNCEWLNGTVFNGRKVYPESRVFLKSFSALPNTDGSGKVKEFLPMWDMYGDGAQGCCIILDSKTFSHDLQLRKVFYLEDDANRLTLSDEGNSMPYAERVVISYYLSRFENAFTELMDTVNSVKRTPDEALMKVLNNILERISYLFKKDTYQYENEVRLIKFLEEDEQDSLRVIDGNTPKVYWYYDKPTFIKEVILGARFAGPNNFIPFIQKQGRKMWKEYPEEKAKGGEECPLRISQSGLQYR